MSNDGTEGLCARDRLMDFGYVETSRILQVTGFVRWRTLPMQPSKRNQPPVAFHDNNRRQSLRGCDGRDQQRLPVPFTRPRTIKSRRI